MRYDFMIRELLIKVVIFISVVGLLSVPVTANDNGVRIKDGIKIIEINTNDPIWKKTFEKNLNENAMQYKDGIFMVHGVELQPTNVAEYFKDEFVIRFAKLRGYNAVVLFEYIPEGKRYFGRPSISAKAGHDLVQANAIYRSITDEYPSVIGDSLGTVVINKGIDEMKEEKWGEIYFTGSPIDPWTILKKLDILESKVSKKIMTTKGEKAAIYFITSPNDIVQAQGSHGSVDLGDINIILKPKYVDPFKEHGRYREPESVEEIYGSLPVAYTPKSEDKQVIPATSIPLVTPRLLPTTTLPPPPWDDGNGGPGWGLGGVDFTDIHLSSIYSNTSIANDGQFKAFRYVLKAKKAEKGDEIINIEATAGSSLGSFFTGLAIPESEFWVNLNPWEPEKIIDNNLKTTDVGRIMLEADLRMKKNFGKYENPCESKIGEEYWRLLDEKRVELIKEIMEKHPNEIKDVNNVRFIPVTRHWIIPDKVEAYETDNEISIVNATLNINSEPVYEHSTYEIANQNPFFLSWAVKEDLKEAAKDYGRYVKELEENMTLPLVVNEVNHGINYSDLRRVYISLALAQWYKNKYRYSPSIFTDFIDSINLTGLKSEWSAEGIWNEYKRSFEQGEYNCWKNETHQEGDYIITRSSLYSEGGVDFMDIKITNIGVIPQNLKEITSEAVYSIFAKEENDYYFGDSFYVLSESAKPVLQKEQATTGFDVVFAIAGFLAVVYLIRQKK